MAIFGRLAAYTISSPLTWARLGMLGVGDIDQSHGEVAAAYCAVKFQTF